ncbi:uncharacterized protein A1O9_03025 [Exophiala aquamarina CBS 119918]|uniref:BZIP domain-containing protein n=1 Tax=Exophiala aquamarina CBS 119918 TaxID=1182545 RepID=A0A072PMZ7_9EURO|nr:uncharacterized protein A1O9_03025 [Exophiala aquamarina CBS 119918]KEF61459.1 hypothetical protein A1O9_03025 [Exophiala aquamarina CBS 119918]
MAGTKGSRTSYDESGDSRKARKRATDRRAQQHHRQRRKAYVKQLEDTVKDLSDRHSSEERIATLLEEQKRLRERCAKLTRILDAVRAVLDRDEASAAAGRLSESLGSSRYNLDAECLQIQGHSVVEPWQDIIDPVEHTQGVHEKDDGNCYEALDSYLERVFDYRKHDGSHTAFVHDGEMPSSIPSGNTAGSNVEMSMDACVTETIDFTGTMADSMAFVSHNESAPVTVWTDLISEDSTQNTSALSVIPASWNLLLSSSSQLSFLNFPKCASPAGRGDLFLMNLLTEARREHMNGMFTRCKPTLNKLLADPPPDVVAYRLFQFITSYGSMPMHLLLAIFWVQYLLVRWLVMGSREAYGMVPVFMRPSELECRKPHRLYISMLVWPKLREALIEDDTPDADPEAIGIAALQSLPQNWSSTGIHGILSGNDVLGTIEQQAQTTVFWSLDDQFTRKYPRYSNAGFTS